MLAPFRFSAWPPVSSLPPADQWQARANEYAVVLGPIAWADFAAWLSTPLETMDKQEQAYSPLVDIKPGKGGRIAGGPAQFLALEYDDSASPAALGGALGLLRKRGLAAVVYTTANATPSSPRFRVVMPTTAPLDDAAYASCVDHFGRSVGVRPSPESRQRTRLWYRPIAGALVVNLPGGPWDVSVSLGVCPPPPPRLPPPAPSADALAHWPLEDRLAQAARALERRRPAGAFAAACICHDRGVPEDLARALVVAYAAGMGWSFDEADLADRVEHAYEYARDPFGCQLLPSVLTCPDLATRDAAATGMVRR
jgi:hypothetical protein